MGRNNYNDIEYGRRGGDENRSLIQEQNETNFNKVAGVIDQTDLFRLQRLIFRATKGKSITVSNEFKILENQQFQKNKKCVYIIVYWEGGHVRDRIQKICDSFSGQRYELPKSQLEISQQIIRIRESINDARNVLEQTK